MQLGRQDKFTFAYCTSTGPGLETNRLIHLKTDADTDTNTDTDAGANLSEGDVRQQNAAHTPPLNSHTWQNLAF